MNEHSAVAAGDRMAAVATDMVEVGRALGEVSVELDREVGEASAVVSAVGASWHGAAADAFADGWAHVHAGARTVIHALEESARRLEVAADSYAAQDISTASTLLALS